MAYARVSYTGDGSTKIFAVPFPYLDASYVEVRVSGVLKTVTTHYTWLTSSTIQFVTAPPTGATVFLLRNTPKELRLVNYQDAAILREADLDLDSDQAFHIAQETLDASVNSRAVEIFVGGTHYTAGVTTSLTLGDSTVEKPSLTVLFDAAVQQQTEYSLASGVITFTSPIPVGVLQVQVSYAAPLATGLIDGSVTTPKILDGAVTTVKIPDGAVTTPKLADLGVTTGKLADDVVSGLTAVPAATDDYVPIADTSDSGKKKKTLISSILGVIATATTAVLGLVRMATNAEAQVGTATDRALTPANLNATVLGMGQFYQDMTASRASGVTYTNSTGRTIAVSAWGTTGGTTNQRTQCFVGGGLIADNSWFANGSGYTANAYFLVPPGATYSITFTNIVSITKWYELR